MAQTGRQGAPGSAKRFTLIHWVGSPDLSGLCIFFPWGAQHQTQNLIKEMDIFAFWQEAQNFLKARCARLGPWLALPLAAEHIMNAAGGARRRCK